MLALKGHLRYAWEAEENHEVRLPFSEVFGDGGCSAGIQSVQTIRVVDSINHM